MSDWTLSDCAAEGCEHSGGPEGDAYIMRISPVGGPFVGLCPEHYGRSVVLKRAAAEYLGTSSS